MEHHLKQCDKGFMKMAMLKHEKTFRHQVYELHRLYRLQKQLMRDARCTKECKRQRYSTFSFAPNHHNRTINLQLPADKYMVTAKHDQESLLELTLAIGCPQKKRGTPLAFDSNNSFSSSSSSIEYSGPVDHEWVPHNTADRSFCAVTRRDKEWPLFMEYLSLRMT